jgi:hypothetical protein
VFVVCWLAPCRGEAAPPGQSALLNGMHDPEALSWMKTATAGCDRGWITDLRTIGSSGSPATECHAAAVAASVAIIQRLDASGSESTPKNTAEIPGYAASFAAFAAACSTTHVWIVGNEPNFTIGKSDPDCSTELYAAAYVQVHKKLHAVAGHDADLVLVASNSPFSPGCLHSLRTIIQRIKAQGITPDGFALHAYTRASTGSALTAALVTDGATQNDTTYDECPGGATWNDTWHSHFLIYKDYIGVIEAQGLAGKPVFITESGNACDAKSGNACYPDANVGYFQALYAAAAAHNQSSSATKVRAITPYRWTSNDDGTGRDFAIGARPQLLLDLKQAFAHQYAWTTPCGISPDGGPRGDRAADARGRDRAIATSDSPSGREAGVGPLSVGGGCGCGVVGRSPSLHLLVLLMALALVASRRRA